MYIRNNVHLINMGKFYFDDVQFQQSQTDKIKILEKFYFDAKSDFLKIQVGIETINIKVVDNN